jgi:hypothetical protein
MTETRMLPSLLTWIIPPPKKKNKEENQGKCGKKGFVGECDQF